MRWKMSEIHFLYHHFYIALPIGQFAGVSISHSYSYYNFIFIVEHFSVIFHNNGETKLFKRNNPVLSKHQYKTIITSKIGKTN